MAATTRIGFRVGLFDALNARLRILQPALEARRRGT
jgi:hypothetical protein